MTTVNRHEQAYNDIQNLRVKCGIKDFLPRADIETSGLLSKGNIEQIIQCKCDHCKYHRNLIRRCGGNIQYDEVAKLVHERLVSFFALLVYVRKPAFIVPFTWDDINDEHIVSLLGDDALLCNRKDQFRDIAGREPGLIRSLDQEIDDHWTRFLRPKIGKPSFRSFGPRFELPIYGDEHMGSGVSGKVVAFRICVGYDSIEAEHSHLLARKEIARGDHEEWNTLKQLGDLKHPHIVRLLATFQHKDHINMIFPLSNTNLRKFLADPKHGLGQYNFSNIFSAPIWEQARGIVDAMRYIHKFPEGSRMGIHFDLKPENILVDTGVRSFKFLITDFGLAVLKDLEQHNSLETAGGGDEGYGPPEHEGLNRKYDVWSMGCILLELLYFVIWSFKGAEKLADARGEADQPHRRYQAFWRLDPEHRPQLRPGVQKAIQDLKQVGAGPSAPNGTLRTLSPRNRRFVLRMATLIENMLWLDKNYRPSSDQVYRDLIRVLADKEIRSLSSPAPVAEEVPVRNDRHDSIAEMQVELNNNFNVERSLLNLQEPTKGETEVRPDIFRSLRTLLARPNRDIASEDQPVALQVFEQQNLSTRIIMSPANEYTPIESGLFRLKELSLVPAYAFRKAHNVERNLAGLRLVRTGDQMSYMSHDIDGDLVDLRKAHGALMKQDIVYSTMVNRVEIHAPKKKRAFSVIRRSRDDPGQPPLVNEVGPITVQLWREARQSQQGCRLVMYIDNHLLLITQFSESLTFLSEQKNPFSEKSGELPILPSALNNKAQSVRLAYIKGAPRDQPDDALDHRDFHQPALELDEGAFRRQCIQAQQDFSSIKIEFPSFHDRRRFVRYYKAMKEQWESDMGISR